VIASPTLNGLVERRQIIDCGDLQGISFTAFDPRHLCVRFLDKLSDGSGRLRAGDRADKERQRVRVAAP
jgi:hypothetical protein